MIEPTYDEGGNEANQDGYGQLCKGHSDWFDVNSDEFPKRRPLGWKLGAVVLGGGSDSWKIDRYCIECIGGLI